MPTSETAADVRGPYGGALHSDGKSEIAIVATTAATQVIDLSSSLYFNGEHYMSKICRLRADADLYYFWTNASGALLDETATAGTTRAQQCDILKAGERIEEAPAGRYIAIKGSVGKLRISITEKVAP